MSKCYVQRENASFVISKIINQFHIVAFIEISPPNKDSGRSIRKNTSTESLHSNFSNVLYRRPIWVILTILLTFRFVFCIENFFDGICLGTSPKSCAIGLMISLRYLKPCLHHVSESIVAKNFVQYRYLLFVFC